MNAGIPLGQSSLSLSVRDGRPVLQLPARTPASGQPRQPAEHAELPPVEILAVGHGRQRAGVRHVETAVGARLELLETNTDRIGDRHVFRADLRDPVTGLAATLELTSPAGISALRAQVHLRNEGREPVTLLSVSSLVLDGLPVPDDLQLISGDSDWLGESRFATVPLRRWLPDLGLANHGGTGKGGYVASTRGTWSTAGRLPVAALVEPATGRAWLWQVEHNGPWHWEVGERYLGTYLAALGPTDADAQWQETLAPGESFSTVPVGLAAVEEGGLEAAAAAMTAYRRAMRRPHADDKRTALVFNDYMNTLMGDPTTEKLLPLVDAAAAVGAEIFCIDAGWYDEDGDWWDSVGEWEPSRTRFPGGLDEVLDRIRAHGMTPGLWLEPEVVGVRSPLASKLPLEAFFQRAGVRHVEQDRFHLDLRHPDAVGHLDSVVDRLVGDHGVGYFKLDYNINPGPGTELDGDSAGAGLLGHNRAHLRWLEGVLDRHPGVLLENCSSGAMRMDYAMLSRLQLQSTSDQQDPLRYPPIAAAAPLSMLPEQAASWAYPQADMSAEEIAFTLCTGLAGRLYLSGRLDAMSQAQRDLVAEGVRVHGQMRPVLRAAVPFWPLGLPSWDDAWICLGLRDPAGDAYLVVWSRPGHAVGTRAPAVGSVDLPLPPELVGRSVRIAYPQGLGGWHVEATSAGFLRITADAGGPTARVLHLPSPQDRPPG
jgi:alpha-galactosidase